jgi:hypothetical protein
MENITTTTTTTTNKIFTHTVRDVVTINFTLERDVFIKIYSKKGCTKRWFGWHYDINILREVLDANNIKYEVVKIEE